jgi:cold shock CspA family protein
MPTGRLFTYNTAKGYGFITHGNNEKDVFVHASELSKAGIELAANISLAGL